MKLYTIQSTKVLTDMLANKALISNWDYAFKDFLPNYKWMLKQLKKRRPHLHNPSNSLIWLWGKIPDEYVLQHFGNPGSYFIMEINLPTEDVLASDFDAWNMTFFNNPLIKLNDDGSDAESYNKVQDTWSRVFDLPLCKQIVDPDNDYEQELQYVTGEIPLSRIKILKIYRIYNNPDEYEESDTEEIC